jgi:hypothetical protein
MIFVVLKKRGLLLIFNWRINGVITMNKNLESQIRNLVKNIAPKSNINVFMRNLKLQTNKESFSVIQIAYFGLDVYGFVWNRETVKMFDHTFRVSTNVFQKKQMVDNSVFFVIDDICNAYHALSSKNAIGMIRQNFYDFEITNN